MFNFNPDSKKFTEAVKSHRYSNDFSLKRIGDSTEPVKLVLGQSLLSVYSEDLLLKSIPIDKNFLIKYEDLNTYELKVSFVSNEEPVEWKIYAKSLSTFTEWKQALLVSRRPNFNVSNSCNLCSAKFHIFRKKIYCKYCGNTFCSKCCLFRANLPMFGYVSKQEVCKNCVQELRQPGYGMHSSLVYKRKIIETRSILE
jgi:FYVE zinc finger